jgi:toxin ParE1/3/4
LSYRLLAGADNDIDRVLHQSARRWGFDAAERYNLLMEAVFSHIAESPDSPGSQPISKVPGVRAYPLRLGRTLIEPDRRVARPRHIVVYRLGTDGLVEIIGLAHDRMLLDRAARRMQRQAGR